MISICKNCGKRMEVSPEYLNETGGVVVCPQCLTTIDDTVPSPPRRRQPRPVATMPASMASAPPKQIVFAEAPATPPPHRRRAPEAPATPPPHRRRVAAQEPVPPRREPRPRKDTRTDTSDTRSRGCLTPHSPLGCLWRTVVFTLVLLTVYTLTGFVVNLMF